MEPLVYRHNRVTRLTHWLNAIAPSWREAIRRSEPYAGVALVILAASGVFSQLLGPPYRMLAAAVLGE